MFLRITLAMNVAMYLGLGLAFLFWPAGMAGTIGLVPATNTALTDIRATYGGFELGVATVLIWLATTDPRRAQVAATMILAGFLLARSFGILVDTPAEPLTLKMWAIEIGGTAMNVAALWVGRRANLVAGEG